jgi:hypothetical protein
MLCASTSAPKSSVNRRIGKLRNVFVRAIADDKGHATLGLGDI